MTHKPDIVFEATPHAGQALVRGCPARVRVLCCGRRWGKTRLGVNLLLEVAGKGEMGWWVAPDYKRAEVGWRPTYKMAQKVPDARVRLSDRMVELPGGGELAIRSADNPESLRGEGLNLVVIDECAFLDKSAWEESLMPALIDKKGDALLISTPKGRNFFWREWRKGHRCPAERTYKCIREECPVWRGESRAASFKYSSYDNPFLDKEEIDEIVQGRPERFVKQEIYAEFIEDGAGVFRNIGVCAIGKRLEEGVVGHAYVIGIDWGRLTDPTVFSVFDVGERKQVRIDRLTTMNYEAQKKRLWVLYKKFGNPLVIAETNAMGRPLIEALQAEGMHIEPFFTTNSTKANAVDALALALEEKTVELQDDDQLKDEMMSYEGRTIKSGATQYSAPDGTHDDCVMATMLSWVAVARDLSGQQLYAGGTLSGAADVSW